MVRLRRRVNVKEVVTQSSGSFFFTARFNEEEVSGPFLEAEGLSRALDALPLFPALVAGLNRELAADAAHLAASLANSPLTRERVGELLSGAVGRGRPDDAEMEVLNWKAAAVYAEKEASSPPSRGPVFLLTEGMIKEIHGLLTDGIKHGDNTPGEYRDQRAKVGSELDGGPYIPPATQRDIKMLMKEFVSWINSAGVLETTPRIRAALAHYHLVMIHPFGDGNGRTARLVESAVLAAAGLDYVPAMLPGYCGQRKEDYLRALGVCAGNTAHDVTAFLEFILGGHVDALSRVRDMLADTVRLLAFRQYCEEMKKARRLTRRQCDLVAILPDLPGPFAVSDLFTRPPFKKLYTTKVTQGAAEKDIETLTEEGFIAPAGEGRYCLRT